MLAKAVLLGSLLTAACAASKAPHSSPGTGSGGMAGSADAGAVGGGGRSGNPEGGAAGGAAGAAGTEARSDASVSGGAGGVTDSGAGGSPGGDAVDSGTDGPSSSNGPDPSTLLRKHLFGYQGWHFAAGDGSPYNAWKHWFRGNAPTASEMTFDIWPDMSELGENEKFGTQIDGAPLYSSITAATVDRHFGWMEANHLDGVFLQRFANELTGVPGQARDEVGRSVMAAAEAHDRVFAIMYDISGATEATLVATLENDWRHLVNDLGLTRSSRYQRHAGKPVVAIWGLGFTDRVGTPQQAQQLIAWFKGGSDNPAPATLVGGVPTKWRTASDDAKSDPASCTSGCWRDVYRSFDVISPWAVGRYADDAGADSFSKANVVPDLAEVGAARYMPVVFPGYSFSNASAGAKRLNEIPRRRGAFYWHQVGNAVGAGATMLYTAMFDEVDEATAMYKLAARDGDVPPSIRSRMLNVNSDEPVNPAPLPSDWYLQLGDRASRVLRGDLPFVSTVPTPP